MRFSLADAILWCSIALCLVAQLALLHSFFLGASRPAPGSRRTFRATETLWVVLPAVGLAVLLAATWRTTAARADADAAPPPSGVAVAFGGRA